MKIFMASYGGAHVEAIFPLIKEIERRGHEYTFLALTIAHVVAKRKGVKHNCITDFVDAKDSIIQRFGQQLFDKHHNVNSGIPPEHSIAYLGSLLGDKAAQVGQKQALEEYAQGGLNSFMPVETAKHILQQANPDWVLATASPRMEAAIMRAAVELGIPSLCMVDLFAILEMDWLKDKQHAHWLSVYGPKPKQRLVQAGRNPEKILELGFPSFDNLRDENLSEKAKKWRLSKDISKETKTVLWAEQPEAGNPDLPRSTRQLLGNICEANGWKLVVRLHPASTDPAGELIPENAIQSFRDEELPAVAFSCDVVVTFTSTVAMEMLLLKKPAIILKGSQYDHLVNYSEHDGALIVENAKGLEAGLRQVLTKTEKARQLEIARSKLPKPGKTSEKILEFIEQNSDDTIR